MTTWPATLPQRPLLNGYSEQRVDANARSSVAVGPSKTRRRYTAVPVVFNCQWSMTTAQLAALETFYVTTLLEGSTSFDWPHPRSGSTVTARFVGPYTLSPYSTDAYTIGAQIEVLP